jgi:DNA-binding NarL/FixJ family response regulator
MWQASKQAIKDNVLKFPPVSASAWYFCVIRFDIHYERPPGVYMVRILIIDDNLIIRHMLKMHIELDPDLKVVGEKEINVSAAAVVLKYKPDVVIVDFDMSGRAGKQAVEEIHQAAPEIPVIATSLNNSDINVIIAKEAGAIDFVVKQADSINLIRVIRVAVGHSGPAPD